ncbi:hypothetical protein [Pusillimonas noertemannii]|uniref:hypothetical protein n=1 Tax=Pusillimonas noertemannii TaxID=305977 RepID=UPI0033406300
MTTRETARQFAVLEESDFWLRRGRMDEAELKHLLAEICAALAPLHERGQVHGRIAPSCVCLEASGRVFVASFEENGGEHFEERGGERAQAAAEKKRLLAGSEAYSSLSSQPGGATAAAQRAAQRPAGDKPLFGILPDGYAAFEQYMGEAAWPVGPWSDVHALSALAHALITGNAPQDAVTRMANQHDIGFDDKARQRYSAKTLAAVRRGLSIDAGARQQSLDEFLLSLGIIPFAAAASGAARSDSFPAGAGSAGAMAGGTVAAAQAVPPHEADDGLRENKTPESRGKPLGWALPLAVLVLLAAGMAVWWSQKPVAADSTAAANALPRQAANVQPSTESEASLSLAQGDSSPEASPQAPPHNASDAESRASSRIVSDAGNHALPSFAPDAGDVPQAWPKPDSGVQAQPATLGSETMELARADAMELAQADAMEQGQAKAIELAQAPPPDDAVDPAPEEAGGKERDAAVTVQAMAGGRPDERESGVKAARPETAAKAEPRQAAVEIRVNVQPWGEVFIDGASRGVSPPLRTLSLPPGEYQVSIRNGDLPPAQSRLAVRAGQPAAIRHEF